MRSFFLTTATIIALVASAATSEAKSKHKHYSHSRDHIVHVDRGRAISRHSRTIYVIERNRPIKRVVYIDDSGRYYRYYGGRRQYVRGRYYESYPSRYYYSDGRPRIHISVGL